MQAPNKMCDGKSNRSLRLLFFSLVVLWSHNTVRGREVASDKKENPIVIRGGLVFSEESPKGPIYVNQPYFLTTRTLSTKQIGTAIQSTYDIMYTYNNHCDRNEKLFDTQNQKPQENTDLNNHPKVDQYDDDKPNYYQRVFPKQGFRFIITKTKHRIKDAPSTCIAHSALLPEARTNFHWTAMEGMAVKYKVTRIYSGMYFDEKGSIWRFKSDESRLPSEDHNLTYGGSYGNTMHVENLYGKHVKAEAENYPTIYFQPGRNFHYRIASDNDLNNVDHIMCMILTVPTTPPPQSPNRDFITLMTQLTRHACHRDAKSLETRTRGTHKEVEDLLQIKFNITDKPSVLKNLLPKNLYDWSATMSRTKREASHQLENRSTVITQSEETFEYRNQSIKNDQDHSPPVKMFNSIVDLYNFWYASRYEHMYFDFFEWLHRVAEAVFRDGPNAQCDTEAVTEQTAETFKVISYYFTGIQRQLNATQTAIDPWLRDNYNNDAINSLSKHAEGWLDFVTRNPTLKSTAKCRSKRDETDPNGSERLARNAGLFDAIKIFPDLHKIVNPDSTTETSLQASMASSMEQLLMAAVLAPMSPWNLILTMEAAGSVGRQIEENLPSLIQRRRRETEEYSNTDYLSREKRGAQAIAGSLGPLLIAGAATNAIISLSEGGAPLAWAGSAMSSIFGLATQSELQQLAKALQAEDRRLENLEINGDQIVKAISALNNATIENRDLFLQSQGGTAMLITQQDLKEMSRHMTVTVDITILKYVDIYQAAANGKVSPHVFTQSDLDKQVTEQLKKGIKLTSDLSKVKMMLTKLDNQIVIIFNIPIEDPDQMYTFYKVTPIPIFTTNHTVIPRADLKYVALAKRQPEYLVLDEDEFDRCVNEQNECRVTSPIRPRNLEAHCVIYTYTTNTNKCPLEKWNSPQSTFIMYRGNTTIYSVGNETTIFIRCSDPHSQVAIQDDTVKIKGTGSITLRAGCTASLPDGTKWHTPAIQTTNKLGADLELYAAHNTFPSDDKYVLNFDTQIKAPPPQIVMIQPLQEDLDTAHEFATAAFGNKNTLIPYILRVLVTLVAVAFLAIFVYVLYRKSRKALGHVAWLPCIKPLDNNSEQYNDLYDRLQTVQQQLKLQFNSFKNAMSSKSLASEAQSAMTEQEQQRSNRRVHYKSTPHTDEDDITDFV